jgi:quercetin dioxygenase-like cupin family protein
MTEHNDTDPRPDLTPPDIDHTHLPDQTMYRVTLEEASHFEQGQDEVTTYPLFITNEFKFLYFEIEPDGAIDWHTHTPGFDEVCMCLNGRAEFVLEQEDGDLQTLEIGPREFVYLPGGARHRIEGVGGNRYEGLVVMPSDPVARMEMVEGASPYRIEDWPVALWIDRKRDEVVSKDAAAVSK